MIVGKSAKRKKKKKKKGVRGYEARKVRTIRYGHLPRHSSVITTSHLYPVAGRCHSHSRTLSPALQITVPVAYTFRILAIGGIAFNLAVAAWPRGNDKHFVQTFDKHSLSRSGSFRRLPRPKQLCRFGKQRRNGDAARPEIKSERDRTGDACFATIRAPKFVGLHTLGRSFASSRPLLRPRARPLALFSTGFSSLYALSVVHSSSRLARVAPLM